MSPKLAIAETEVDTTATVTERDAYRPAGVFISYAWEDHDLAQAVYQSLQALGENVYDRVKVFLDSKSIDEGDDIRDDIRQSLEKSDFLIVLYTGVRKPSHYTGWEVGFFDALMQQEKKAGKAARKLVSLYLDEPPAIADDVLGISIKIDPQDLGGSRADYVAASKQSPDNPDPLARLFHQIAARAESRFPPQLQDPETLDRKRQRRRTTVAEDIIPGLRGKFFDTLSTRITRRSVEQRLVEFDLPCSAASLPLGAIPDDAKLTQHSGSFEIFGIAYKDNTLSWKDFKREIQLRDQLGGSSILLSIEQVLLSAISPTSTLDNDQIMKSMVNDSIYRILVTRQVDFYNGRKIVDMYFVQRLMDGRFGNADTTIILGFINVAAKYRFIFIERDSPLSVESFSIAPNDADLQNKVRRLTRELLLIEEEARSIGLDQPAAIYKYFGSDQQCLGVVGKLQLKWYDHRKRLMASAERVLRTAPDSAEFKAARDEWLTTLSQFRDGSEEINSIVTTQALENLKKSFAVKRAAA